MTLKDFSANFQEFDGKNILITGGTGSFGKVFVQMILTRCKPKRLIIFSRDELKQYEMQQDAAFTGYDCLRFFIGDVRDLQRLKMAMRGVDYVVHAAALKHVPIAEYNPFECIKTNVYGAENVVVAALENKVTKVVALSTDKAASPVNLYGASKLASDKIFVAANNLSGQLNTRFCVVRYGNVLGSRGSVVPYFKKLIREGKDYLPITDPRMTRFWITLEKGVEFVVSCFNIMHGGEIFIPKIPSMRVKDLANSLAPNLSQKVTGIRPGEKLHEIMVTEDDARNTIEIQDRYIIQPELMFWKDAGEHYQDGKAVNEKFSYTSDNNSDWLSGEELARLVEKIPSNGI